MRFCIHCGNEIPDDSNFCTKCGLPQSTVLPQPVIQRPSTIQSVMSFGSTLGTLVSLAMFILAAVLLFELYLGIPTVAEAWNHSFSIFIILNGVTPLFTLDNSLFIFYIFFIVMILASFAVLIMRSKTTFVRELTMKPVKEHSPLYTVCTLIMVSVLVSIIIQVVIPALTGQTSHSPSVDDDAKWQILFSAAEAPVWEELISRVLLIGIPLLVVDLVLNAVNKKYERKPLKRYILGGGFSFGSKEILFLLISSIMFGYAHLGGWDVYKIIPATVAGLAMGYLFLKYGLYASISFHAINNLIGFSTSMNDNPAFLLIAGLVSLLMVLFGIPYLANYAYKVSKWISKSIEKPKGVAQPLAADECPLPEEEPVQEMHSEPEPNTIGFRCKNCGNDSAVFENGELVCTRCRFKN